MLGAHYRNGIIHAAILVDADDATLLLLLLDDISSKIIFVVWPDIFILFFKCRTVFFFFVSLFLFVYAFYDV